MTAEQTARDMLSRAGVDDAQSMTAVYLAEIAGLIAGEAARKRRDEVRAGVIRDALDLLAIVRKRHLVQGLTFLEAEAVTQSLEFISDPNFPLDPA